MSVTISSVVPDSAAFRAHIKPGEALLTINGHPIHDILDYRFYMMDQKLVVVIQNTQGKKIAHLIRKEEYEELGLEFETYLMDKHRTCKNKCIFCFVDQMPPGMRESLYVKDDDARLSFLFGNYITLTNLDQREIDRIKLMHISPINVSVHTTNPQLRVQMMKNPHAGRVLEIIQDLCSAGIKVNTQIVLCPGVNDGEELKRSLSDLGALYPNVQSIACVPLGITKYREGLTQLRPYTKEGARETIQIIHSFADQFEKQYGQRVCYPSDEFFLKAQLPLPDESYYGSFDQLENGVGMLSLLEQEFMDELAHTDAADTVRHLSLATGAAAYPMICALVQKLQEKFPKTSCRVYQIENDFFGRTITVAGLITATDLMNQLKEKDLGSRLLIPNVMLRHEQDRFLDDYTIEDVSSALGVPIGIVDTATGNALVQEILSND